MLRRFCFSAVMLLTALASIESVEAQQVSIGPGGVRYYGYGRGYYGGYGQGYQYYGPRVRSYHGYGTGPYGYGGGSQYQFPSSGTGSSFQFPSNQYYNNGYYTSGTYGQYYTPVYNPYGFVRTY